MYKNELLSFQQKRSITKKKEKHSKEKAAQYIRKTKKQ